MPNIKIEYVWASISAGGLFQVPINKVTEAMWQHYENNIPHLPRDVSMPHNRDSFKSKVSTPLTQVGHLVGSDQFFQVI